MRKMILLNSFIPIATFVFQLLLISKIKGERILTVGYRLWFFDYGFLLILSQLLILILTFFIWKERNYRLIAVLIFFVWIVIYLLLAKNSTVFD